jgi:hypothetical protein
MSKSISETRKHGNLDVAFIPKTKNEHYNVKHVVALVHKIQRRKNQASHQNHKYEDYSMFLRFVGHCNSQNLTNPHMLNANRPMVQNEDANIAEAEAIAEIVPICCGSRPNS